MTAPDRQNAHQPCGGADALPQASLERMTGELVAESTGVHAHKRHQWLRVTQGLMIFNDGHKRHILSGHNAAFIPRGIIHSAEAKGQRVQFQSLYAAPALYEATTCGVASGLPETIVVFQASLLWRELFTRLCDTKAAAPSEEPLPTLLRLLWLLFAEEQEQQMLMALPQTQAAWLQPALEMFEEHLDTTPRIDALARACHVSPRTLQRGFRQELGCTPLGYLKLLRIFTATVTLTTTDTPIMSIALDVGYESLSAFYQAFGELTGMTPKHYRDQHT